MKARKWCVSFKFFLEKSNKSFGVRRGKITNMQQLFHCYYMVTGLRCPNILALALHYINYQAIVYNNEQWDWPGNRIHCMGEHNQEAKLQTMKDAVLNQHLANLMPEIELSEPSELVFPFQCQPIWQPKEHLNPDATETNGQITNHCIKFSLSLQGRNPQIPLHWTRETIDKRPFPLSEKSINDPSHGLCSRWILDWT